MRSKASGLALVVVAGLVAGCASSGYQPEVDWPAGWQVITESIPPEASDVEQLGSPGNWRPSSGREARRKPASSCSA
ncbi:DUF4946 domain-containing protein [Pseudomonas aeruginosa]|uniref:DUF4946 domain-containing protein n=1 Tax=Pseudomonas aeruginosa TaxID=287 RepID=UPI00398C47B1